MSVIFSHALNAIKNNSDLAAPILSKPATLISKTAESSRSILSRIKKTSKSPNSPRVIRKQSSEKNIMKVSHKLIKKPTNSIVLKTKPINNSDVWTHDLYTAPPQIITQYYRVFIRNLPEFVDSDLLKKSINEKFREYVLGIKVIYNYFYYLCLSG